MHRHELQETHPAVELDAAAKDLARSADLQMRQLSTEVCRLRGSEAASSISNIHVAEQISQRSASLVLRMLQAPMYIARMYNLPSVSRRKL